MGQCGKHQQPRHNGVIMPGLINIDPTAIINLVTSSVDRIWPDKTKAQQEQLQQEFQLLQGQLEINKAEANSGSLFIAGARPFLLWVCSFSLVYDVIIYPISAGYFTQLKPVDTTILLPILMSLIGLRSWEKGKNIDTQQLN
jgi:hypothetical protein